MKIKLSGRERIILIITALTAVIAAAYVYLVEPIIRMDGGSERSSAYLKLLQNKDEINARYDSVFSPANFSGSPGEQQLKMMSNIEKLCKESGIREIFSVRPLGLARRDGSSEIQVHIELKTTLNGLVALMRKLSSGTLPYKVIKMQVYGDDLYPGKLKCQLAIGYLWVERPR